MSRAFVVALALFAGFGSWAHADEPVYELRIYKCNPGKLDALQARFRDHTLGFFEKHGIKNVAYWTPANGADQHDTLIYLLEHASPEAAKASWEAFRADEDWKKVAADSQKDGPILLKEGGIKSISMKKTDYSPAVLMPQAGKLYELRTYVAPEGKLADLNSRFRDHTDKLFRKHGMNCIGYWTPTDAPASENTLIYVLEYDNAEAAKAAWTGFLADPEWHTARKESEKNGKLTAKPPESVYMTVTDYSPKRSE